MYSSHNFRKLNVILKTLAQLDCNVQCRSCCRYLQTAPILTKLKINESNHQGAVHSTIIKCRYHPGLSPITKTQNFETSGRQIELQVCDRLRKDVLLKAACRDNVILSRKPWLPQSQMAMQLINQLASINTRTGKLSLLTSIDSDAYKDLMLSVISSGSMPKHERNALLKLLEEAASARISTTDFPTILLLADMFYVASHKASRYHKALFRMTHLQWERLSPTPANLVQLLFFVAVERDAPVEFMRVIENSLLSVVNTLSARDLSLVCHAFFASNTSIRKHKLLYSIASVVLHDLKTTPAYLIVNILKVCRHAGFTSPLFYEQLGEQVSLHGESINVVSHFVDAYAGLHFAHDRLFVEAAQQYAAMQLNKTLRKSIRIKDLGRMLWAFTSLQHELPSGVIEAIVELLRQNPSHWRRYPEAFLECLVVMVMNGVYPDDLINYALSPKFIQFKTNRALEQHYQLLLLDSAVGIESPQYTGNRLSTSSKEALLQKDRGDIHHELTYRQGLAALYVTLVEIFNTDSNTVACRFILESSKLADVEFHLAQNGQPQNLGYDQQDLIRSVREKLEATRTVTGSSVTAEFLAEVECITFRPQTENFHLPARQESKNDNRKISVKVMGWNQYAQNKPILLGHSRMELRLLQSLGYEIIVINPRDAAKLNEMTKEDRVQYVKDNVLKTLGVTASPC